MPLSEAQVRRVSRRADVKWSEQVVDPRDAKGQQHAHHGMLSLLVAAFACGRVHLRDVEAFSEDLGLRARRVLGLSRRISDTALYELLSEQGSAGFRETAVDAVRGLIDAKVVKRDLFPKGVLTTDGKSTFSSTSKVVEGTKTSTDKATGITTSSLMALKAVLSSSSVRPCVDAEFIPEKSGEAPAFRVLFPRACANFDGQFEIVTGDAGLTCRENALLVLGHGKHFLFALKGNQELLHEMAEDAFFGHPGPARAHTVDVRNGGRVFRELHIVRVADCPEVNFPGVVELWRVTQATVYEDGRAGTRDIRYFVSSMPADYLSAPNKLGLVRLHWGIENGHNWTADVALQEDAVAPCQANRSALEVVGWLRILAYNLLASFRVQEPKKDRHFIAWRRAMECLRDLFVFSGLERALATRS